MGKTNSRSESSSTCVDDELREAAQHLAEFVDALASMRAQRTFKRVSIVLKEGNQTETVLSNPAFKSDPLAANNQNLESTQPDMDEQPARKYDKIRKKKSEGNKSKASTGPQTMEI
ncbi:hypothetical protein LguiA_027362 [Lonicera macranthoides]